MTGENSTTTLNAVELETKPKFMDVSLLSALPVANTSGTDPETGVPLNSLSFTVAMIAPHPESKWCAQGPRTQIPQENGNLPYHIARDLAEHFNSAYQSIGRNRVAVVTRSLNGVNKYGVLTVERGGTCNHPVLRNVKFTGLPLQQAMSEVEKLNRFILEVTNLPKVWAVAIVEGEGVSA